VLSVDESIVGAEAAEETVVKPSAICGYSRFIRVNSRFSSFLNANGRKYPRISTNPEWRNGFPDSG